MALWTPANLATQPDFWFDAADEATLTLDGSGVLNWADKGTDGLDAYQATPDYQPQIVENALNGKPVISFAGGNPTSFGRRLSFTQQRDLMDKTLIFVWSGNGVIFGLNQASRTIVGNDIGLFSYARPWEGDVTDVKSDQQKSDTYGIGYISPRDFLTFYVNGVFSEPNPARKVDYTETYAYTVMGGSRAYDTFNGAFAEVLLLDSDPTDADRERIEGYLAHKWGITSSLVPSHPYFNTAPVTELIVPVSIPNAPDGARYRISNQSRSNAEIANGIVSGGAGISTTFIADDASVPHVEGDTIHVDVTYPVSTTAYLPSRVIGQASASGVSGFVAQVDDDIYNFHGIDGSALTIFEADFVDDEIDIIVSQNFVGAALYAFYVHSLTLEAGIREWLGAITAIDNANFRVNTSVMSIKLDNDTVNNVWQTDNVRVFRDDGARPVKHPTTGGGGIDVNWRSQVYTTVVTTSEGVITGDISQVPAAVQSGLTSQGYTTDRAARIDTLSTKIELDAVDAKVDDIQTKATRVDGLIENSTGDRFTAKALEAAPTAEMEEAELHAFLDSYTNKGNWKADVSSLATSAEITALNDLSTADIDARLASYDAPTLTEMTAAFAEIKGAGWTTTDTLESIRDAITNGAITAADIWTYTTKEITGGTVDTVTDINAADIDTIKANQAIMNNGIKKSSLIIPHTDDVS